MQDKIFLITQCATDLVCLLVSLYILVPMAMHLNDFRGHCALFSCGQFIEDDGHFEPEWASNSACIITIIIGFLTFICSLSQLILKLRLLYKNQECLFLHAFLDFFTNCLVVLFVLFSGILVTTGLFRWCRCVTQRFNSCDIAASVMEIGVNSTIVAKNFSYQLGTVQIGVWALLVCVFFQLMLSTRKVLLHHERQNLIAAMLRERRRFQHPSDAGYSSMAACS